MTDVYLKLNEEDFRALVRGGEVIGSAVGVSVHLILADIGFDRMALALDDAISGKETYKGSESKQ